MSPVTVKPLIKSSATSDDYYIYIIYIYKNVYA